MQRLRGSKRADVHDLWRRALALSWPVMAEQVLRTMMRTTDILVAGFFSPAAVAAVGIADIYSRLPLRIGLGLGDGAIALASQDTGSGMTVNRDEAVSQALLLGLLAGVPFIAFGLLGSVSAIELLGADRRTVRLGSLYLAIIMVSAPAFHVSMIASRAIQGTGNTRTPMLINAGTNGVNIVLTVVLAFGLGPFPRLSVVGIAAATAIGDVLGALVFVAVIHRSMSQLRLVRPTRTVIGKQLLVISTPRIAEGLTEMIAEFPFNAILLTFGTEVNAAYHIGGRMYAQIAAPLSRGYSIGANVLVGQALGRNEPDVAFFNGAAVTALATLTIGAMGLLLYLGAEWFVLLFTRDPATIGYAADFARAYAIAAVFIALFIVLSGSLRGGSETRPPFVAKTVGLFVFLLGITYVFGLRLGYGVVAAYVAIAVDYVWRDIVLVVAYARGDWLDRGTSMMRDRGSLERTD